MQLADLPGPAARTCPTMAEPLCGTSFLAHAQLSSSASDGYIQACRPVRNSFLSCVASSPTRPPQTSHTTFAIPTYRCSEPCEHFPAKRSDRNRDCRRALRPFVRTSIPLPRPPLLLSSPVSVSPRTLFHHRHPDQAYHRRHSRRPTLAMGHVRVTFAGRFAKAEEMRPIVGWS